MNRTDGKMFALNKKQVAWLKMLDLPKDGYDRFKGMGGSLAQRQFEEFLRKEGSSEYGGVSAGDARKIVQSVGLTMEMLEAISLLDVDLGANTEDSPIDELETVVKACADFLWTGIGKTPQGTLSNETVTFGLVRDLLNRDKTIPREVRKLVLGDLFDYLSENRMFEEYRECLWGLSRKAREDLCRKDRPWFPGCSSFDTDGRPIVDMAKTNGLRSVEFDEAAILVRCVNMQINAVRAKKFTDYLRQDSLSLAVVSQSVDPKCAANRLAEEERLARERDEATRRKDELKLWIRKSFAEADMLIRPVWEAVGGDESLSPYRWRFLCAGARLFYDWARYHWYSLDRADVKKATDMYKKIMLLADKCLGDENADVELKAHFMYMAATACRYMAEAMSAKKWTDGKKTAADYVVASICYARKATELVPVKVSKSLGYRFNRNLARIQTFAVRWWLKHGMPDMVGDFVYEREHRRMGWTRGQWGKQVLDEAYGMIKETLLRPMSPDERRDAGKGPLCLRGKRLLEWEFHLRVQIEVIVAWLAMDPDAVQGRPTRRKLARCALALILLNYGYLCRGVTHLSRASLDWALEEVRLHGLSNTDIFFESALSLDRTVQANPPDATCRFEIINSIFKVFGSARPKATRLYEILDGEAVGSPAKVALAELEKDLKEDLLPVFVKENNDFCKKYPLDVVRDDDEWVAGEKWKDLPAFRHLNELIWGPGSNPKECERMLTFYGLDWNYYGKGDCHA